MKKLLGFMLAISIFALPFGSASASDLQNDCDCESVEHELELDESQFKVMEKEEINKSLGQVNKFSEYREVKKFVQEKGFKVDKEEVIGIELEEGIYSITYSGDSKETNDDLFVNVLFDSNENKLLGLNSFVLYNFDEKTNQYSTVEGYTLEKGFIEEITQEALEVNSGEIGTMSAVSHVCNLGGIAYCTTYGFMVGVGFPVFGGIYGAACSLIFYFGCP